MVLGGKKRIVPSNGNNFLFPCFSLFSCGLTCMVEKDENEKMDLLVSVKEDAFLCLIDTTQTTSGSRKERQWP
jgi:hypothetical protein